MQDDRWGRTVPLAFLMLWRGVVVVTATLHHRRLLPRDDGRRDIRTSLPVVDPQHGSVSRHVPVPVPSASDGPCLGSASLGLRERADTQTDTATATESTFSLCPLFHSMPPFLLHEPSAPHGTARDHGG